MKTRNNHKTILFSCKEYFIVLKDFLIHTRKHFSYSAVGSFIGGGNRSTRRKPPTCRKSLTNSIT